MSSPYASNYDAPAPTDGSTASDSGLIDKRYVKSWPGLLKALEMVFSLIAYICVATSIYYYTSFPATTPYFKFITMACFTTTLLHWALLLFKLHKRIFRCSCVFWPFVEVVYYGGLLIMLFFGDLFLSLHASAYEDNVAAHQAGAAFGWFAFFTYCIDAALALRTFLRERGTRGESGQTVTGTTMASSKY